MSIPEDLSIFDFHDPLLLCRRFEGVDEETPLSELLRRVGMDLYKPGLPQVIRFATVLARNARATRLARERPAPEPVVPASTQEAS